MTKTTPVTKTKKSGPKEAKGGDTPSQLIDARIKSSQIGGARRSLGRVNSERVIDAARKRAFH
jgi:hypothetical protein